MAVFRRLSAPAERRHSTVGISFSKAVVTSERVGKESTTMMFGLMLLRIARENSLLTAERWASVQVAEHKAVRGSVGVFDVSHTVVHLLSRNGNRA